MPFTALAAPSTLRHGMANDRAQEVGERVGDRIKRLREEHRWTQEDLARRTASSTITGNVISRWERHRNRPSQPNLEELAQALEVDASYLLFGRPSAAAALDGAVADQLRVIGDRLGELVDIFRERPVGELVEATLTTLGVDVQALPRSDGADQPPAAQAPRSRRARRPAAGR